MNIKVISDNIAVSAQLRVSDIKGISEAGYQSIVCNRPDGEAADQIAYDDIKQEAEKFGILCAYIPIQGGKISDDAAVEFDNLINYLPKPILAYCRTGTRSITLWALANSEKIDHQAILSIAKSAGYDLSSVIS